jgi:hypothetical protein
MLLVGNEVNFLHMIPPLQVILGGGGAQRPLVPLLLLGPPFFLLYFSCPPSCQTDDQHLLAHAMALTSQSHGSFLKETSGSGKIYLPNLTYIY